MNLNTEDKKKSGYRTSGLLGIPKDVIAIFLGLFVWFALDWKPGLGLIALGTFGLFVDFYFLNKGKDERK